MVVEVGYNYQPINVRQRTDQSLKNAGRITPRSCNTFAA